MGAASAEPLAAATALYQAGDYQAIIDRFGADSDAGASLRQLRAQAAWKLGRHLVAASTYIEAARLHAESGSVEASRCIANALALLVAEGRQQAALHAGLASLAFPPDCDLQEATLQQVFKAALHAGDGALLIAVACAGSTFPGTREICLRTLLDMAHSPARYGLAPPPSASSKNTDGPPFVSIVVCSPDNTRFGRFAAECQTAFAGAGHEVIRIPDAVSMCEGYQRGLQRASGSIVVFCHDDIEFLSQDVGSALARDLANADVVVSVGGLQLVGPTWFSCGPLGLQGWMAGPTAGGYNVGLAGVPDENASLATGDGCFIALRRETAMAVTWEPRASTGFHLYDLDFCARARAIGLRIAPIRRVAINHLSGGNYGETWKAAARHFLESYGIDGFVLAPNPWVSATATTREEAGAVLRNLGALIPDNWRLQLAAHVDRLQAAALTELSGVEAA